MNTPSRYWFRTKQYGWGWGMPATWQGWAAYGLYAVGMVVGGLWLISPNDPVPFALCTVVLSLLLLGVCYAKGEPPAWRWGKR